MTRKQDRKIEEFGLGTYIVRDLEQAKLLSDPLRLSILQALAGEPRTTKQVADELNESPTKLYRHVDSLLEAGLLELVEERPKRGTVEKYLVAIASRFVIDPTLFLPGDDLEFSTSGEEFVDSLLAMTREELGQLQIHNYTDAEREAILPLIMRAQIQASPERIAELRKMLLDWIEACQESHQPDQPPDNELLSYAAMLAFYPLEKPAERSS